MKIEEERERKMKRALIGITLIALMVPMASGQDLKTIEGLRNFLWINTDICTAGQPTDDHLLQLKEQGVKAVLNIRRPMEHDAEAEAAAVHKLGMNYFNIPVDGSNIQDAQVVDFLDVIAKKENQPLFIHCGSANRVGAFWMIKRAIVDGWTVEKAEDEARRVGMRSPGLVEFARDYIQRHATKQPEGEANQK